MACGRLAASPQLFDQGTARDTLASDFTLNPKYLADEPTSAPAQEEASEKSAEELAKLTQNPVANLISVPFQNNFNFGIGPKHATQWVLNIQPVIPITLNEDWNLITRTIVPIIYQESSADGVPYASGLGDINPSFFFSPVKPWHGIIWGFGPTFTFPTGTDPQLTSGEWTAGPAAVALRIDGPWVYGALINQQWSFAGWGDTNVSAMLIQPFVNYNFKGGWYLTTSPIITANWKADSDNVWTVPIGGGASKILKLGKLPINVSLQGYYNVVTPDDFGADWQLRFQVQFLFPR
jgi:hypothetical protein